MIRKRSLIEVGVAFSLLAPGVAMAQVVAADATSAEDDATIVVTAQRRSEALERTPVAIAVVGSEALAKQAITSERDLQFATPGLIVRAGQNDNQLNYSLRGQTVDAYTSSLPSVLPYINEVQVGGSGSTAFYDLQSVQVLKGPQGTLFGRNSTGGAVLFTTAKPGSELGGFVTGRYGRFNDLQIEGAVNLPLSTDKLLLRVAASHRQRDGLQLNLFDGKRIGVIDRTGGRVSLTLFPDGPFTNELVVDYFSSGGSSVSPIVSYILPTANYKLSEGYPAVPNGFIFPEFEGYAAVQKARGPWVVDIDGITVSRTRRWFVSNISSLELSDAVTLKNVFGFVRSKYFESGDIDATPFAIDSRGDASTGPRGGDGLIKQFSNELQLVGKVFDDRLDFVVGGYFSHNSEHLINTSYILPNIGNPVLINAGTTTSRAIAGYAQGTLDTGLAGFKLTAGVRYTSERVKFVRDSIDNYTAPAFAPFYADGRFVTPQVDTFKKPSWTLGLQNQVADSLLIYANTRRSFRSGGFNFQAPPTPGFANISGGEYRPEIATDVEFGAKYRGYAGDMPVRLSLALYNMWVKDVQRANYVQIYGNLAGITVNVPKAKVYGFELDGTISPTKWLNLGGSLNYTNAKFTDNRVPVLGTGGTTTFASFDTYPDTPEWSGSFYADVTVPVSKDFDATLRGEVYAQSSSYYSSTGLSLNPNTNIAGYALANFRFGIEQRDGGLSFAALVKNAFDKEYYSGGIGFASLFALNIVVPGEPRTFLFEVSYKF